MITKVQDMRPDEITKISENPQTKRLNLSDFLLEFLMEEIPDGATEKFNITHDYWAIMKISE